MHDHRTPLEVALDNADRETIGEILRQSEIYLESQLSAGLAADQRAMSVASILASALAVVIGGGAALTVAGTKFQWLVLPFIPMAICFMCALWLAVQAAKPSDFEYRGNSPGGWLDDLTEGKSLQRSLAEQARHYEAHIECNNKTLRDCGEKLKAALDIAFLGLLLAAISSLFMVFAGSMYVTKQNEADIQPERDRPDSNTIVIAASALSEVLTGLILSQFGPIDGCAPGISEFEASALAEN